MLLIFQRLFSQPIVTSIQIYIYNCIWAGTQGLVLARQAKQVLKKKENRVTCKKAN
jgi:hypothetical protein